ncbi:early E2A DNA-binding protein [Psittacine adenovirus 2]|nr:early E2A DNA-binding protein [Psittacine adenovirus 2]
MIQDEVEANHQKAMQLAAALSGLFGCSADINVLPISDFWPKIVETYVRKNKPDLCLTISNNKSFNHFCGRLVASFTYAQSGLVCHFNSLGTAIWLHQWKAQAGSVILRCFHGEKMVDKPITYHFSPHSEEGARALLNGEGKTEKGKNQREVVKLTNSDNIVCHFDKDCSFPVIHTGNSCGLIFGNKNKAEAAYQHNVHWTSAMFPKANQADIKNKMIIVTKCFCNFGSNIPQLGRQMCKLTPFEIPGANDIDEELCSDEMMRATAKYKNTFVFQCCNPVNVKKTNKTETGGKHCDFKLSMIDIRLAMKLSKEIWNKLKDTLPDTDIITPKIQFPLFEFDPKKHSFKNAIVVHYTPENDDDPFC